MATLLTSAISRKTQMIEAKIAWQEDEDHNVLLMLATN